LKQLSIIFILSFAISANAQTTDPGTSNIKTLNTLKENKVKTIQEVVIKGKKPVVENKIDKIVYNVANDVTSQSGAAIYVLRKVPQVTVDADGNVELQGNPNVRFLINGKPSSIFGNSLADALASIPASQIKSIEAVTSPGAKYDAQGTGGIINIVLNESKVKGINGLINASAGTRFETGSSNLNFRSNNFSLNTFFSGNAQLKSRTPSSQSRLSHDSSSQLKHEYCRMATPIFRDTVIVQDWVLTGTLIKPIH
jgi:ferric enterobactin receptor